MAIHINHRFFRKELPSVNPCQGLLFGFMIPIVNKLVYRDLKEEEY
jgi:hypothetical protein